jgi:hypothetical protein
MNDKDLHKLATELDSVFELLSEFQPVITEGDNSGYVIRVEHRRYEAVKSKLKSRIEWIGSQIDYDSLEESSISYESYLSEVAKNKLSERKTVHQWLNMLNVPSEENGKPLCLLRRLSIALFEDAPAIIDESLPLVELT